MQQTQLLSVSLSPKNEDQIISVPFTVSEELNCLQIEYKFLGDSVIDLGVAYENEPRGWSGGARSSFSIYPHWATPGYKKALFKGQWQVLLGTYKIVGNVEVEITITQTLAHPKWYKGDLHCHSHNSDGALTVQQLAQMAADKSLDFLALTDHNTSTQNQEHFALSPLILIPGMEYTTTKGHANFLGVKEACKEFRGLDQSDFDRSFAEARQNGATIGINHPFSPHPWLRKMEADYYEIWNGPWCQRGNDKNRENWYKMLKQGMYMPISGGSDFHKPQRDCLANPTTHIYANSNNIASLLEGLSCGKSYITASPEGSSLDISSKGENCLGEKIERSQDIHISLNNLTTDMEIHFVTNSETTIIQSESNSFDYKYKAGNDAEFMVIEIWQGKELLLISNPVFIEHI